MKPKVSKIMINVTCVPDFFDNQNLDIDLWSDWIREYDLIVNLPYESYDKITNLIYHNPSTEFGRLVSAMLRIKNNLKPKYLHENPCLISLPSCCELEEDYLKFLHNFLLSKSELPYIFMLALNHSHIVLNDPSCNCSSVPPCKKIRVVKDKNDLDELLIDIWKKKVREAYEDSSPSNRGKTEKLEYYYRILHRFLENEEIDLHIKYLFDVIAFSDEQILQEMKKMGLTNVHRVDLITFHSNKEIMFIEAKSDSSFDSLEPKFECSYHFACKYQDSNTPILKAIGVIHNDHFIPDERYIVRDGKLFKKLSSLKMKVVDFNGISWYMFNKNDLK